ncbi:MAG: Hsp20/alpha crystallin family protein [Bacteroidales bacterium]|nr:Hsp20/alpha crystallin family protein [Bacteroidales bacterium]
MLPQIYKHNQGWLPNVFDDLFNDDFFAVTPGRQFASPAVNVIENEKDYQVELAAPGMTKKDFQVHIENDNELVIALEKKEDDKKEKKNYLRREFSYASYRQVFIVPEDVEAEKISAAMTDGILRITLPKKEVSVKTPAKRQIEVC